MNNELCRLLNEAVENHNDYADDSNFLYWWDVLNEIEDMTDDEEVMDLIARIDRETERMKRKEAEERIMRSIIRYMAENQAFTRERMLKVLKRYE
jgi:hypothetical protein